MTSEVKVVITGESQAAVQAAQDAKRALAGVTDETKDAAKATEGLNLKKGELHRLIRGLPPEFSQAGAAVTNLFFNPMFAGMLALTAIYQTTKKYLDDWNKSLDAEGLAAAESATGGLENHRKALEGIGDAIANYRTELDRAGIAADPLSQKIKDQNELYNLQVDAIKKVIDARGVLELDSIKGAHDIAALNKELYDRGMQIADLEKNVQAAKKEKETADTAQANAATELAGLQDKTTITARANRISQAEKAVESARGDIRQYLPETSLPGGIYKKNLADAEATLKELQAKDEQRNARRVQLEQDMQSRRETAAAANAAFSAATTAGVFNQTRIRQLPGEIGKEESKQAVDVSQRGVADATRLADKLIGGGKLEAGQQQFLMRIANLATGHANNLQQAATAMHSMEGNNAALLSLLGKLIRLSESNRSSIIALEQAAHSAH